MTKKKPTGYSFTKGYHTEPGAYVFEKSEDVPKFDPLLDAVGAGPVDPAGVIKYGKISFVKKPPAPDAAAAMSPHAKIDLPGAYLPLTSGGTPMGSVNDLTPQPTESDPEWQQLGRCPQCQQGTMVAGMVKPDRYTAEFNYKPSSKYKSYTVSFGHAALEQGFQCSYCNYAVSFLRELRRPDSSSLTIPLGVYIKDGDEVVLEPVVDILELIAMMSENEASSIQLEQAHRYMTYLIKHNAKLKAALKTTVAALSKDGAIIFDPDVLALLKG